MSIGIAEKVLAVHRMLVAGGLPHGFGGALALAYCTLEPRGTKDIDVNVFIGSDRIEMLVAALEPEVALDEAACAQLRRDAQTRLWWGETPVDVFLSNHAFHDEARQRLRLVPFGDIEDLPVLACADLAVFKAFFARPKDVLDLATMAAANTIDLDDVRHTVAALMGGYAERADFFAKAADTFTELQRT